MDDDYIAYTHTYTAAHNMYTNTSMATSHPIDKQSPIYSTYVMLTIFSCSISTLTTYTFASLVLSQTTGKCVHTSLCLYFNSSISFTFLPFFHFLGILSTYAPILLIFCISFNTLIMNVLTVDVLICHCS